MFAGLDTIAFSVENNIMVFETEEDYQKCLDFLGTLEVKDYQLFEKEVGFSSLPALSNSVMQTCPIEDEKFATLLNPQMQIIIEHYLFTLNHDKEKVEALFIGNDYDLKSIDINSMKEFSYDDVFAILKGDNLKSVTTDFCGQENSVHEPGDGIVTKVDYNKYGIYNSLVSKIYTVFSGKPLYLKHETIDSPLGIVPPSGGDYKTITSRCFYRRVSKQNNIIYSYGFSYTDNLKKTLWDNRRRLTGFRLDMKYSWKFSNYGTVSYDTNMIECHQY
ncbi:hypothetical protein [uncultured Draconibacterium sp.]|uniref:hypothetical protein n=1 Tax=uncultured Draconibacterium sp. TaxID=1573823 RepID=UPI002AA74715|nr:hypothetical protein [uncultured Draconibacterium sp.]